MGQLGDNFDPENLRWKGEVYVTPSAKPKTEKHNGPKTKFIPSVSGPWIAEAAKLSGHAIHIAVVVYLHGKGCDGESILTDSHFESFGISEKAVRYGLSTLQQAGLVEYLKDGNEYRIMPKPIEPRTWFIAPMPCPWITAATKLPSYAVRVALAIMYVRGMSSGKEIVLTRFHFNKFNTPRGPAKRGLDGLQQAGLIEYNKDGQKFKVTILPVEP